MDRPRQQCAELGEQTRRAEDECAPMFVTPDEEVSVANIGTGWFLLESPQRR